MDAADPFSAESPEALLRWDPGERETYLRRLDAILFGAAVLATAWILLLLLTGPTPLTLVAIAVLAVAAVWGIQALAMFYVRHTLPVSIRIDGSGIWVTRGRAPQLIPWDRLYPRFAHSAWFVGYRRIQYQRFRTFEPGALWVSRSMAKALYARPETEGWQEYSFLTWSGNVQR